MADSAQQKWFAHMLEVGLETKVVTPALLLSHVGPDILAHHLPPEVLSRLLAASLAAGVMTADGLLETLTPGTLSENVPLDLLWRCLDAGADRTGIGGDR